MSKINLDQAIRDLESDDISLETTVPTDLSYSPEETSGELHNEKKKKISKQLLERKQLLHDLQLCKIELSQKSMLIDNLNAEHMQKVEELEEKLNETLHQKQVLHARLEGQLKIQQEEARRRQDQIQKELDTILKRQQQLEETNERLQDRAIDIRRNLNDLDIDQSRYQEIKQKNEDDLALRDFVSMKLFEMTNPWRTECEEGRSRLRENRDEIHRLTCELHKYQDELESERRQHTELHLKHQRLSLEYSDTKARVQHGDYKIENFDKIKRERDDFEQELSELKKQHGYVEASYGGVTRERDQLTAALTAAKQTISLLQQDKEFFSRQVTDLHNKLLYTEDRATQNSENLERAKQAREELYEKYVASKDQYKAEYEAKLRDELERLRQKTDAEIDRLKTGTKELYERENRNLRETRDMALQERDKVSTELKMVQDRYEHIVQELRQNQISSDNHLTEVQGRLKIRDFEAERAQLVLEETTKNLKNSQMECEKLLKKQEVLTKEYYALQASVDKRVAELEGQLNEKTGKLETYEKLESELDNIVMQAAEMENEDEAERILFSYGYGANVPTTAKRRLKQSVHLAHRVLQLERANTSLQKEIERERAKCAQLGDEVKASNDILEKSQQPYHYLIESLRVRDDQIAKQKEYIHTLEKDIKTLKGELQQIAKTKNQMASDLERLLGQKEEVALLKQVVLGMSNRSTSLRLSHGQPQSPRLAARHTAGGTTLSAKDENIHLPKPTTFTKGATRSVWQQTIDSSPRPLSSSDKRASGSSAGKKQAMSPRGQERHTSLGTHDKRAIAEEERRSRSPYHEQCSHE